MTTTVVELDPRLVADVCHCGSNCRQFDERLRVVIAADAQRAGSSAASGGGTVDALAAVNLYDDGTAAPVLDSAGVRSPAAAC